MIINKEGKLFGKVSIIDIAAILMVVVLAFGIYLRFGGNASGNVVSDTGKIECTFLIKNVRDYSINAFKKSDKLYDFTSKEYIGDIKEVRVEEGEYKVNLVDGSFVSAGIDERKNVYVTVQFDGKKSDDGYYTAANKYLVVGTSATVTTKYAKSDAVVDKIGEVE